jgi:hypothetical protein
MSYIKKRSSHPETHFLSTYVTRAVVSMVRLWLDHQTESTSNQSKKANFGGIRAMRQLLFNNFKVYGELGSLGMHSLTVCLYRIRAKNGIG